MSREPTRLADTREPSSPESAFVGGILRAHRPAHPSPAKMQELARNLGPLLDGKVVSSHRTMTWLGLSVVGTIFVAGAVLVLRPDSPHAVGTSASTTQAPSAPTTAPAAPEVTTEAPPSPAISVDSLPNVESPKTDERRGAATASARCDEVELIDRADTKLRAGDPAGALGVTREHEQRCTGGALVQERERIAVEALAKLGRVDAARARAKAFEARFPASPHLRRVRQVVDELSR
jgi:hypothetical protein